MMRQLSRGQPPRSAGFVAFGFQPSASMLQNYSTSYNPRGTHFIACIASYVVSHQGRWQCCQLLLHRPQAPSHHHE